CENHMSVLLERYGTVPVKGDDRYHLLGKLFGEREESGPDPARCDQRSVSVHSIRCSCFPGRPRVQFVHFPTLSERAPRQRGPYVNVMFSTWVQPRMGAALGAHSNTRGIWPDPASRGFEGAMRRRTLAGAFFLQPPVRRYYQRGKWWIGA